MGANKRAAIWDIIEFWFATSCAMALVSSGDVLVANVCPIVLIGGGGTIVVAAAAVWLVPSVLVLSSASCTMLNNPY